MSTSKSKNFKNNKIEDDMILKQLNWSVATYAIAFKYKNMYDALIRVVYIFILQFNKAKTKKLSFCQKCPIRENFAQDVIMLIILSFVCFLSYNLLGIH